MPVGPFSFLQRERARPHHSRSSAGASLQPTLPDRFVELLRPGWSRIVRARRIAAGLLAVILALRGDPDTDRVGVVVAAHDLAPGHTLTADDVAHVERDRSTVVAGTLHDVDDAVGHTLAGPVPAGEPLVDTRLLGPRLAAVATGSTEARVVPIRLADAGVSELLREGDRVDVLTVTETEEGPLPGAHVLARGAVVVLAESGGSTRDRNERVVLVALEPEPATAVAAASLVSALTVTLH
ncbi:SAF domain-containing protein [Rhodococcus rhodochrous]|uniref:SAF domain-containing protein n=1 Tax=Rhodococcus rhodochrous TaxID=1829 RepID=UPI001E401942|nr:SAF domain-containing protein [Rhodococcus rhodochrous]MCD2096660.1 SAF domain-containing protein [Rhodococcus rhodochrous]MCD2121122.1 SAF domain-containing protein [Rhodococcus rhodochrous]MCQ4135501.1 SAF domain-containing protein [Rhodococcus rhodochrous]MDJ0020353.1 SAF domain-containing protein [Rhodococcus rhodochrous]